MPGLLESRCVVLWFILEVGAIVSEMSKAGRLVGGSPASLQFSEGREMWEASQIRRTGEIGERASTFGIYVLSGPAILAFGRP
jgi:hypothetical protein